MSDQRRGEKPRVSADPQPRRWMRGLGLILLTVVALVGLDRLVESPFVDAGAAGEREVLELFESRRSGEMVAVGGVVDRLLSDDDVGSRHQRFIVRLGSGHTLLVAHNVDLAPRIPLRAGDQVLMRGEYEWNGQGGVLHWTHHDPDGQRPGGWIEWDGDRYR